MRILMALCLIMHVYTQAMDSKKEGNDDFIPMLPVNSSKKKKGDREVSHPLSTDYYDEENPPSRVQYYKPSKGNQKKIREPEGFEELESLPVISGPVFTQHPLVNLVIKQPGFGRLGSQLVKEVIDHADAHHKHLYNALVTAHTQAQVEEQTRRTARLLGKTRLPEDESKSGAPHTQQTMETFLEALVKYNEHKIKVKDEEHAQKQKEAQETLEENKRNARKKLMLSIITNGLTLVVTGITTVLAIVYGTEDCDSSNSGGGTGSLDSNEQVARNVSSLLSAARWWKA